jgi:AraC-like DNA-binding protein/mannose-6-phosphate isomerase-like protein (cupin superfamily)
MEACVQFVLVFVKPMSSSSFDWRSIPPAFEPALSRAQLTSQNLLFWLGDGQVTARAPFAPHWHDTYELGIILSGHGIFVVGGEEYPYQPGQSYIIDDIKPHMTYTQDDVTELFVVHFQPELLTESWIGQVRAAAQLPFIPDFSRSGSGPMIPLDDPVTPTISALLYAIRAEGAQQQPAWEVILTGLILQVVGHLARRLMREDQLVQPDPKKREAYQRIHPILHLIEERFADNLTLDMMAREAYLSRSHCCALFQQALNTSPIAYRNQRRLREARHLLQHSDLTVRDIAYQIGFSSVQEFNRLFLREASTTPTAFRRRFFDAVAASFE